MRAPRFVLSPLAWSCLALFAVPGLARAADAAAPATPAEPARPPYLAPRPDGFSLPPVAPAAGGDASQAAGPRVRIQRIEFRAGRLIGTEALAQMAAPAVGQELGAVEIEALRQRLTRQLIADGFVNSGVVLDGELGVDPSPDGVLRFAVVEGRVQAVQARGLERLNEAYVRERLVRGPDEVLDLNVLRERFQLLLDDPLIDHMNAKLLPGEAPGQALLDIEVARARPYQLSVSYGNTRPPSIGADALGLAGWVRNLTGRGDLLEAGAQVSARDGTGLRANVGWHVPLNARGTQLSVLLDHGRSAVVEEPLQVLDITSKIDSKEVALSQTLVEHLDRKLSVGLSRVRRENRTWLLGEPFSFTVGEPSGVTRIWSWRFWQEFSYRTPRQVLALRSTFSQARTNLAEASGLPFGSMPPAASYGVWLGQAQFARQIDSERGTQVVARLTTQQTSHRLPALDQLSIGGAASVRGYRENQLIRDRGTILNLELDVPVARGADGLVFSLIPFYDIGRGRNQGEEGLTLSSAGLAARLRWRGLSVDLAVAKRLSHPDTVARTGSTLQDQGIHLRVAYEFFGK